MTPAQQRVIDAIQTRTEASNEYHRKMRLSARSSDALEAAKVARTKARDAREVARAAWQVQYGIYTAAVKALILDEGWGLSNDT